MADIEQKILDAAVASKDYQNINRTYAKTGHNIAQGIMTVLGSVHNGDLYNFAGKQVNDSARVTVAAKAKAGPAFVPIDSDQKVYVRPNGDNYYARPWGDHQDVQVVIKAREKRQFILMKGQPGTGKTALAEAAFAGHLYTVMGTGDTTVEDFLGGYTPKPGGGYEWFDGPLPKAMEEGAVLFIDEIGLVDPKVLSVVYGVMDGRDELTINANPSRGIIKSAPGFYVLAATNPKAPGVRLSEALLSRFTMHVEVTTDWNLAKTTLKVPFDLVKIAQNMAKKVESREATWAPQMRELLAFRDIQETFGEKFAFANLIAQAPEFDQKTFMGVVQAITPQTVFPAVI